MDHMSDIIKLLVDGGDLIAHLAHARLDRLGIATALDHFPHFLGSLVALLLELVVQDTSCVFSLALCILMTAEPDLQGVWFAR